MSHRLITILAALALLGGAARADQGLEGLLARARSEGLPVEALKSKIQEGRAKKVPEPRIRAVIQQLMQYMARAQQWMHKGKQPVPRQLVVAAAQARLAGISEQRLRELVPPGSKAQASLRIDALVDLHLRGYSGGDAQRLVQNVERKELPGLGGALERLRKKSGLTHAEATDALLKAVKAQHGSLHRAMQRLGSTASPGGRGPAVQPTPAPKPRRSGR